MTPLKYYVFKNIMENGASASFSIIFSKVFKTLLFFFLEFFSMLSKNRKLCHDLKIAYGGKCKDVFTLLPIPAPTNFRPVASSNSPLCSSVNRRFY